MKKASALAAVAAGLLLGLVSMSSQAGTATGNFNVAITFTSKCVVGGALAPTFAYTSLQAVPAVAAGTLSYTVTCTSGVPYTMALDATGASFTGTWTVGTLTGAYTNTLGNLAYTLVLPAATAGTGAAQTYTMSGGMIAGQAGACTSLGGCTYTDTHTLTVTF